MSTADADILSAVRAQFHTTPPARMGIAVSGGGDSMALLHILAQCFDPDSTQLFAATVDHGLRPEAAAEAELAANLAQDLGIHHDILKWGDWDGAGNLQEQARRARYSLLSDWAKSNEIAELALGHTADDQAETVLMRLARSSGVTGLAAMPLRRTLFGVTLLRPLLGISREQLRDYLGRHGLTWAEDPSNENLQFDRIKARRALEVLAPLGLTSKALSDVARNMNQAREALDWYSFLAARDLVQVQDGDVVLDLHKFRTLPDEISRRLLLRAIMWLTGSDYPPRSAAMSEALNAVRLGKSVTLGGCRMVQQGGRFWICREYNAVRRARSSCVADSEDGYSDLWDGRWRLRGNRAAGCEVRALGRRGLMQCPDWRDVGRPHAVLTASPAVWRGDDLIAAPMAGMANGWHAELIGGHEEFFATLLSH